MFIYNKSIFIKEVTIVKNHKFLHPPKVGLNLTVRQEQ